MGQTVVAGWHSCSPGHRCLNRSLRPGQFEHSPSLEVGSSAFWVFYLGDIVAIKEVVEAAWCDLNYGMLPSVADVQSVTAARNIESRACNLSPGLEKSCRVQTLDFDFVFCLETTHDGFPTGYVL